MDPAQATAAAPSQGRAQNAPERFIVYLFDDLHVSSGDLMALQKAATKMVAGSSLTNTDMAAVVSLSGTSSGLTNDRAKAAGRDYQPEDAEPYAPDR